MLSLVSDGTLQTGCILNHFEEKNKGYFFFVCRCGKYFILWVESALQCATCSFYSKIQTKDWKPEEDWILFWCAALHPDTTSCWTELISAHGWNHPESSLDTEWQCGGSALNHVCQQKTASPLFTFFSCSVLRHNLIIVAPL